MKSIAQKRKEREARIALYAESGEVARFIEMSELKDKVDDAVEKVDNLMEHVDTVKKMEGKPGYNPIKGKDYFDGKDYVLTPQDKEEIIKKIEVPVVEKVIEKIETIREQPIVQETVKEVPNKDTPTEIKEKLEAALKEEGLDAKYIKGLSDELKKHAKFTNDDILMRATAILDQRTSFLINKLTNLQNQVNALPSGGGGGSGYQTPTSGAVNGSNQTFVWTTAPNAIAVDGMVLNATSSDGTVNFTSSGTTTVLTVAPNNNLFGIA